MKLKRRLRRLGFHALKTAARLSATGGPGRLRTWGERLGRLDYVARARLRQRLITDLAHLGERRVMPRLQQDPAALLHTAYQTNDRALLEILALYASQRDPKALMPPVRVDGLDRLAKAQAPGLGVVLVGMHMGNGVALAAHLNAQVAPTHVVYRESNKIPRGFFRKGLERLVASAIGTDGPDGGLRAMLKVLRRGEMLFILADQGLKTQSACDRFLDKPFQLPTGPAQLALKTGAPLVPVLLTGVDVAWQFEFQTPMWPGDSGTINELNFGLIQLMEQHILQHPQWWSWHQRRWSKHPFCETNTGVH